MRLNRRAALGNPLHGCSLSSFSLLLGPALPFPSQPQPLLLLPAGRRSEEGTFKDSPSLRFVMDLGVWFSRWIFWWILLWIPVGPFSFWKTRRKKSTKETHPRSTIFKGDFDQNPLREKSALRHLGRLNRKARQGVGRHRKAIPMPELRASLLPLVLQCPRYQKGDLVGCVFASVCRQPPSANLCRNEGS